MKTLGVLLLLAVTSPSLHGIEVVGGDYGGADLIPANGDVLRGTFTSVGLFQIGAGNTVFVFPGTPLVIYASSISIIGKLDGIQRGQLGGTGGTPGSSGASGFGAGPAGIGAGGGGGANAGGGGGGHGNGGTPSTGGSGNGASGGSGGVSYGSTGTVASPLSPDDTFQGSGGGGGGGGADGTSSGVGGSGGAGIYLEAGFVTLTGTITVNAADGGTGVNSNNCTNNPGGGGGGSGGGILIRAPISLTLSQAVLSSQGGKGGDAICNGASFPNPGGGGSGGRIKLFYRSASFSSVILSTAPGKGGESGIGSGTFAASGSTGTFSTGLLPSSPTAFAFSSVFMTSITWTWNNAVVNWGDASPSSRRFRLYAATSAVPLDNFFLLSEVASAFSLNETNLSPNTTAARFLAASTDWGNGNPSLSVTTHTLANFPGPPVGISTFTSMGSDFLTLNWGPGTPSNPSYTRYEVLRSTVPDLNSGVTSSFVVGLSSQVAGLVPNTTYHFQLRALNLGNLPSPFGSILSTATLAADPVNPAFSAVHVSSFTFTWSSPVNPPDTLYQSEISIDSFQSLVQSTTTPSFSSIFTGLNPGSIYSARVRALNRNGFPTSYTNPISTSPGNLNDLTPPTPPGSPQPDRNFSYDGAVLWSWSASQHAAGILDYFLEIGSSPGGNDFFSGNVGNALSYGALGLSFGKTYYARVRSRSNAGVFSNFSSPGTGVSVWQPGQAAPIGKPYTWPNPFDPRVGEVNIGFSVEKQAEVTLKMFTLQGDLVHQESRRVESSGNQVWGWSGRNDRGRIIAPGGYIGLLRVQYPDRTESKKFKLAVLY